MNFLVEPKFSFAHRNRYLEGTDDGQKTPRGQPNFNSYVKKSTCFGIPDAQTDRWTDRETNLVWASLTMFLQINWFLQVKGLAIWHGNEFV
jgi:hypothetical protein